MESTESKGLGDDIEKVLEATGIAKVAKAVLGDDCGCEARKNKLNQMFPRGTKQLRCFTPEEADKYGVFMTTREEGKLSKTEVDYLLAIYKEIYGKTIKIRRMGCYSCQMKGFIKAALSNLDKSYKLYTEE